MKTNLKALKVMQSKSKEKPVYIIVNWLTFGEESFPIIISLNFGLTIGI